MKVDAGSYRRFIRGEKPPTTKFVIEFCKKFGDNLLLDAIYASQKTFTARRLRVILPTILTPKLAYYTGYLYGDGYLTSDEKRVGFTDEDLEQIEYIKELTKEMFGWNGIIRETHAAGQQKPCYEVCVTSTVINYYFHRVFGMPRGVKKDLHFPALFLRSNELKAAFIAGAFDSDGTLPKHPEKAVQLFIDITYKDQAFIEEIREALSTLGISTLEPYCRRGKKPFSQEESIVWELRIRRKAEIRNFLEKIPIAHPNKKERAIRILSTMGP
ncbi:hypothetical protein H0O03_03135 [Candidatus Micrarchaeota archaeon]|nr:hypothetical protein [Candidatus Micrarchaeota archaeon]